jgi:aminopeptidase-like protein
MSFEKAFNNTVINNEKIVWTNTSGDNGGETFAGISRVNHPNNLIWEIIDEFKKSPDFPDNVNNNPDLLDRVKHFYYTKFWYGINGDRVDKLSSDISGALFDAAVNNGVIAGVGFLQKALNISNSNERYWPDINVDGNLGPVTIKCLSAAMSSRGYPFIFNMLVFYRAKYDIEWMEKNKTQEKFVGIYKRMEILTWTNG